MGPKILEFAHLGHTPMLLNPPAGAYATADGWITVTLVKEAHFASLMAAMELPEVAADARYGSFPDRQTHQDTLKPPIVARMKERTTDAWLARFEEHGVLAGRVRGRIGDHRAFSVWVDGASRPGDDLRS